MSFAPRIALALIPIVIISLGGCGINKEIEKYYSSDEISHKNPTVSLSIYSGLPDPIWELNDKQTIELNNLLINLPSTQPIGMYDNLGYKGFHITIPSNTSSKSTYFQVLDGVIRSEDNHYFVDKDRVLEKWLLATSKETLDPRQYEEFQRVLNTSEPFEPSAPINAYWVTYHHSSPNFSFSYPGVYNKLPGCQPITEEEMIKFPNGIWIRFTTSIPSTSVHYYVDDQNFKGAMTPEEISIDNTPAIRTSYPSPPSNLQAQTAFLIKNGYLFTFEYHPSFVAKCDIHETPSGVFERILQGFNIE